MNILSNKLKILYEYDSNFFTYVYIEKEIWNKLIREAMDKFKIIFDLENNSSTKSQRIITIPQKYWEHTDCKFKCEMWKAGGDWQIPVIYFKCQIISGYCFYERNSSYKSHFCFIPGKTEGNYHLVRGKDNWSAPDNSYYKEGIDPEPNERDCWKSLENYLKNLVDKEINNCIKQQHQIKSIKVISREK